MEASGDTVLITVGGSGIGQALAHRLHDGGATVIVAGRGEAALRAACAGRPRMYVAVLDVADAASVKAAAPRLLAAHPALNVLINNAGVLRSEPLDQPRDLADAEAMTETNFLGPIRMVDALIHQLIDRPGARIINVTSGTAFVPFLATPTYSATKAALHVYTVALREALKGRVEVVEIVAPSVRTGLTPGQETRSAFMPLDEFADEVMTQLSRRPVPPEILVGRAALLRAAEREGRFDEVMAQMNAFARAAGQG